MIKTIENEIEDSEDEFNLESLLDVEHLDNLFLENEEL